MVIEKAILATGKWINGKWVKAAAEAVTETASRGRWVNGKWVKEATKALEEGKVYTKMKPITSAVGTTTSPIAKEAAHTRLPEGMLPEELTMADIRRLFNDRYYQEGNNHRIQLKTAYAYTTKLEK